MKNKWDIMAAIIDNTLPYVEGCLVEIGIGTSSRVLYGLAGKYDRWSFHCDKVETALEPSPTIRVYTRSSDAFFGTAEIPPVAVGFLDGDHSYEQVRKDFRALYNLLVENGLIFIHDTLPPSEKHLAETHCCDAYRFRQQLERFPAEMDCFTFPFEGYPHSCGLTMVRKKPERRPFYQL